MNITQEQLDEAQRKEYLINREEVLNEKLKQNISTI